MFSKEDIITKCHPFERCFFLCPNYNNCIECWHLYNITKQQPLPDGKIIDFQTFCMLNKKGLGYIADFIENIKERII